MKFEQQYFKKFNFTLEEVHTYWKNAIHDLEIAKKDQFQEVKFTYCYQALIKAGIALIAKVAKMKVKSAPGHHIKILQKLSEILDDPDIMVIGDAMRMKRNTDLYGGGVLISKKEARDYLIFVDEVFNKAKAMSENE